MKNRMQDLDFEQTVAFDSVKDFEFTRRAAQRFRQIVSLEGFEEEDADVIFHYLYKEMELVSFGDHLKRYIYERAGIEEPFAEVPQEVYRDIAVESFKETNTPKSMNPTSTKLPALVNNWLTQASVKRETVFLLGFGLRFHFYLKSFTVDSNLGNILFDGSYFNLILFPFNCIFIFFHLFSGFDVIT